MNIFIIFFYFLGNKTQALDSNYGFSFDTWKKDYSMQPRIKPNNRALTEPSDNWPSKLSLASVIYSQLPREEELMRPRSNS